MPHGFSFFTAVKISTTENNTYKDADIIPFQGLSSGERQIAYLMSNLLYHLHNINSMGYDFSMDSDHQNKINYHYVNVMFDEVELYFHPARRAPSMWVPL